MPEPRLNVFISSTSIDLPDYREAVRDAILSLGFFPNGMEHWPVTGDNPVNLCKRMVEESHVYLGIFAHRFGWKPDGYNDKSITELEYDWAAETKHDTKPIPRLCFIIKDDFPWPKDQMEIEAEADLKRFKTKVKTHQVGFFTTPDNLKAQVTAALANILVTMRTHKTITWQSGATFEQYTLRHVLGTGGNGQVWLADHQLLDGPPRQVAVKVLRAGISDNPTRVARFKREISSMARIDHPNIVRIYTYADRGGQLYVIMPYLRGGTLRHRLTGNLLSEDQALHWLEQIGKALDYVHDRHHELIHRDVKPENILLSEDGDTLYLSDFGLVFSPDDDERISDEGKPIGTGRYMAPEQWRNQTLSRRTDLYALGILAYELLTGHLPFQHTNDLDLGNAHCGQDLPANPNLSPEVLRILRKATAKDPAHRYPTARAFLTDLRNWRVDPANLEPRIRDYLEWVNDALYDALRAQFVELSGDETAHQQRFALPQPPFSTDDNGGLFARAFATIYADHVKPDDETLKAFVENVRQHLLSLDRAVLVGEPGSGKTWMLQRLQADFAHAFLKNSGGGRGLIPVLVHLNQYTGGPFTDFVKTALDTLAPYHDQLLVNNRLVILCDALNEMPRGADQMDELITYLKEVPYFIVSCRVRDYRDDLGKLKPLEQVLLHDLELPAIQDLIHKRLPDNMSSNLWTQMGGTPDLIGFWESVNENNEGEHFWDVTRGVPSYTSGSEDNAWYAMHHGARLIPLARTPYMADLLCRTYQAAEGRLPDSRAELFGKFIAQMLAREAKAAARRGETFPSTPFIEDALIDITKALQTTATTVITREDALQTINTSDAPDLIRAATDANILTAQDTELNFTHQLLQEYFAAKFMLDLMTADEAEDSHQRAAELFNPDWWEAGVWRETTVILGEFLGESARGPNRVARWLAPITPEVALQTITRNAAGLTVDDVESTTKTLLIQSAHTRSTETNPLGRAAAYRILGLFDADKRPNIGIILHNDVKIPDIDWVEIPDDGPWTYQDDPHPGLSPFSISRFPITYAQFQTFLDDPEGYAQKRWFEGLAADADDREMREQYFKFANHPRETVNWYQAMAFCRWFSWRLGGGYDLDHIDRWLVRLPTEMEWEKAARGPEGRQYAYAGPYDPTKANTADTGIGQTSAVGIFPDGASFYGVLDMSGNVWEWCLSDYENSAPTAQEENISSGSQRVLRGGSWYALVSSRAVYRNFNFPYDRSRSIGFRVCRPPSL